MGRPGGGPGAAGRPGGPGRGPGAGPGGHFGMGMGLPAAKSKDFRTSFLRLLAELRPERAWIVIVIAFAIVGVVLAVLGPRLLGEATNVIFEGLVGQQMGAMGLGDVPKEQVVQVL